MLKHDNLVNVMPLMLRGSCSVVGFVGRVSGAIAFISQHQKLVAEKPAVLDFILNPMVKTEQKLRTMDELLGSMKFSPTTINLFKIMAENNRLKKLQEVIQSYMKLMAAHRGELACSVTTAKVAIN